MKSFIESEYEIHLDDTSSEYLYFTVRGPKSNYDIARRFWTQVKSISSDYSFKGVLLHDKLLLVDDVSVADYYALATYIAEEFKGVKLAYFRQDLPKLIHFAETVGLNKGLGSGGVFYTLEKAKEFLQEN